MKKTEIFKQNILNTFSGVFLNCKTFIFYNQALYQNRYRCKLVGEKNNGHEQYNTIILYRHIGKRNIFEIPIRTLMDQPELIEQFSPIDAIKLGEIIMGDFIFSETSKFGHETAKQKFNLLKKEFLDNAED